MAKLEDMGLHKLIYLAVKHLTWVIAQATGSPAWKAAAWQGRWDEDVGADEPSDGV